MRIVGPSNWNHSRKKQDELFVMSSRPDGLSGPHPDSRGNRYTAASVVGSATRLFLRRSLHDPKRHECVICCSVITEHSILVPCGHHYDVSCLLALVKAATRDEALFPPRCCQQQIPLIVFDSLMDGSMSTLFLEKTTEFNTVRRVYCANRTCSKFLGALRKGSHHGYTCPECSTRTCSRCRSEMKKHVLHSCRPDSGKKELLQLGKQAGWIQCPGCERLVELKSGCFHVTCICKVQFCYRCGSRWKTCPCSMWSEEGQLVAVRQSALPAPVLPPVPRHDPVRTTWIQTSDISTSGRRRARASAPAELSPRSPVSASLIARGFHAQERRIRQRAVDAFSRNGKSPTDSIIRFSVDSARLDVLEEQIDRLIALVQQHPCQQHDWRMDATRESCSRCFSRDYVLLHCAKCSLHSCMRCQRDQV